MVVKKEIDWERNKTEFFDNLISDCCNFFLKFRIISFEEEFYALLIRIWEQVMELATEEEKKEERTKELSI